MRSFRSSLLIMTEAAAFGWFILRDISYLVILPLIPLGVLFCWLMKRIDKKILWLNGCCAIVAVFLSAFITSEGLFEGEGLVMLVCLSLAVSLTGVQIRLAELERISGWWLCVFIVVFSVMLFATLPGIRWCRELPDFGNAIDILIFYLLVFLEPFSMGKDYRAAPLALGVLLLPFGFLSYLALGHKAFDMAEYPYLSVWSGVSISAFHHIEGIIIGLFYGIGILRMAHFLRHFEERMTKKVIV